MLKNILAFLLVSVAAQAATPPITQILKLKGGAANGVITANSNVVSSVAPGSSGNVLTSNGTLWVSSPAAAGGVSSVTASSPLFSSGGANPNITCQTATGSLAGCLTSTDWTTFNSKEPAISSGTTLQYWRGDKTFQTLNTTAVPEGTNLYYTNARVDTEFDIRLATKSTSDLSEGTNLYYTNARARASVSATAPLSYVSGTGVFSIPVATSIANGYLSSADWTTFNNKQPAGSYVLATRNINTTSPLTGGGDLSADRTIAIPVATSIANGYLSSTDWSTFNSKQAAGNYITALTGDVTASGPGSVAATLATVNSNTGSFGSSTAIPSFTVNGKGLITAASTNVVIAPAGTLTGTTLASNVVTSSLTSVGTITSGTWTGTTIAIANGGTGQTTANAAFAALSPMTTNGDLIIRSGGVPARLPIGANGTHLTTIAGVVAWTTDPTPYVISTVTGTTSAVCGTTYLADTSGGAFTITLPTPVNGCFVGIVDATGTFDTNNLTLARSGSEKINYLAASSVLQTYGFSHVFFTQGTDWFMQ